jgi:hypothetical protein
MSGRETQLAQVDDLSAGKVDREVGEEILAVWEDQSKWLPNEFADNASVDSVEMIVCEREIVREIVATESTEQLELS